jgi:hypothetical protein
MFKGKTLDQFIRNEEHWRQCFAEARRRLEEIVFNEQAKRLEALLLSFIYFRDADAAATAAEFGWEGWDGEKPNAAKQQEIQAQPKQSGSPPGATQSQ